MAAIAIKMAALIRKAQNGFSRSETEPIKKLPNGERPTDIKVNMLITRPRTESSIS
jgi:hypothetical protein